MDDKTKQFEEDLTLVKIDVAVMRANYMRREEGEQLKTSIEGVKATVKNLEVSVENLEGSLENVKTSVEEVKISVEGIKTSIEALRGEMYRVIAAQTWKLIGICVVIASAINVASRYPFGR